MELAIIDTTLITMEGRGLGIQEHAAIGIDAGRIVEISLAEEFDQSSYDQIIDGSSKILLPGLINAHFHSTSSLLRGCAQDVPEIEWMNKAIGPLSKHLKPEDRITGSKMAVLEGLRTGTTTFAEYSKQVAELVEHVYLPLGARVVAAETINEIIQDRGRMNPTELYHLDPSRGEEGLGRHEQLVRYERKSDLVRVIYGPQAVDMVSQETLTRIFQQAAEEDRRVHMHVAQGERERIQVEQRYGCSTIEFLHERQMLNPNLLAAHIHGTSESERQLMVQEGVNMVSCQTSIGMIDGIIPPLYHYTSLGGAAGIGTDQIPGVGHANLFREMRTGALLGKVLQQDPTVLPPWEMLKLATIGGARVLGIDAEVGSLREGKRADIISIDRMAPTLLPTLTQPFATIIPNLVYSCTGYEVMDVIIEGRQILVDGTFVSEVSETYQHANEQAHRVLDEAEKDWNEANSLMVRYHELGYL